MGSTAEVVLRMITAFNARDFDTLRTEIFTPDVEWHFAGDSPVSGDYRGVEEVMAMGDRLAPTGLHVEPLDILAGERYAFAFARVTGEQGNKRVDVVDTAAIRVDDGRVAEFWNLSDNQAALDDFYAG